MKAGGLEELLMEEAKLIFKYLLKMGASKEDAEDIVQDTLYKTIKHIDSLDENKVRAWLFKVAINQYYNLYKKKKMIVHLSPEELEIIRFSSDSAEDLVLTKYHQEELLEALNELKPSYKMLLVFKYFLDLSYQEIASILEMREQNVKVYLYRARKTFKQIWEEKHNRQK